MWTEAQLSFRSLVEVNSPALELERTTFERMQHAMSLLANFDEEVESSASITPSAYEKANTLMSIDILRLYSTYYKRMA